MMFRGFGLCFEISGAVTLLIMRQEGQPACKNGDTFFDINVSQGSVATCMRYERICR